MKVVDANVLLYAASNAPEDTLKRQIALRLLAKSDFGVSIQLLQEFYHNCRIKARLRIDAARTEAMIAARYRAVDSSLRRAWGDELVESADVADAG